MKHFGSKFLALASLAAGHDHLDVFSQNVDTAVTEFHGNLTVILSNKS